MTIVLMLFLGCPLPPEEPNTQKNQQRPVNNQPAQGGVQGGGAQNIGVPPTPGGGQKNPGVVQGAAGGAPGGAPGGILHDLGQLKEQKSQKEILQGEHFIIKGTISGECGGTLRLDVLSLTDSPADAQTKGPLTGKDLETVGEFTVAVPKEASVSLTALCDHNKDQKITEKDDKLSPGARIGKIDADKENVELILESIQPPSGGPDSGTPGGGTPGSGGPGSGGPGAAAPGAGGPGAVPPEVGGSDAGKSENETPKVESPKEEGTEQPQPQ